MRQRGLFGLAERYRRVRRLLATWRRRDPQPWIIALVGMALGFCVFLLQLALLGAFRLLAHVAKALR